MAIVYFSGGYHDKNEQLRMNYQTQLMAVEEMPQFSWIFTSDAYNVHQESYQLQLSDDPQFQHLLFDSGVIKSSDSTNNHTSRRYF